MKKDFIKLCLWISFIISLIIAVYFDFNASKEIIKYLSNVPAIAELIIIVYCKWLWQIKILNFLKVKNLNGTWDCTIKYNFHNEYRQKDCKVKIKQDLFGIQVNFNTDETNSWSVTASIESNHENHYLVYVYKTETKKEYRDGNRDQYGAVRLLIEGDKMSGEYWTNNKTDGIMELIRK